jgi:hypothetical protein
VWFGANGKAEKGYIDVENAEPRELEIVCSDAAESMRETDCSRVLKYVEDKVYNSGARVVTFNGVSFDFRLLAAQFPPGSPEALSCAELAWASYDPCLEMLCSKGFPVGLKAMCEAFQLPQKLEAGSDAPALWASGDLEGRKRVLLYCASDVTLTYRLYAAIKRNNEIRWVSKKGNKCVHKLRDARLHSASELAVFPFPDISWMTKDSKELKGPEESQESERPGPIPRDGAFTWMISFSCNA